MKQLYSLYFLLIAILLAIYTSIYIDENHYFIINAGWNTNLVDGKLVFYLIAGLGLCLAVFYKIFGTCVISSTIIYLHVILYFLLSALMILWDNNTFSLQEAVESQGFRSVREIKGEYGNSLKKDSIYRGLFWILLVLQTIGLFNLMLGFFKAKKTA